MSGEAEDASWARTGSIVEPAIALGAALVALTAALVAMPALDSYGRALLIVAVLAYSAIVLALFLFRRSRLAGLKALALTDSLCGLPNRRALHEDVARHARREPVIALAMIDLDGFKAVNDFYGHFVGDRVIVAVAEKLAGLCGDTGGAYRLGGDEFAVVVPGRSRATFSKESVASSSTASPTRS